MTAYGFVGFVEATSRTVDAFESRCESDGRLVRRLFEGENCTVFGFGEEGSVLRSWAQDSRFLVAFGSGTRVLTGQSPASLLRSSGESVAHRAKDVVALSSQEGSVVAVTGDGAHRLFLRRLSSGGSVISTNLELAVMADASPSIDRSYEDFFLGFGFFPGQATMFEDIAQLPATSTLDLMSGESGRIDLGVELGGSHKVETHLLDRLMEATERQADGNDHCAVFLGGFDSALVCALLKKLGKRVTAYTFDFGDSRFNQAKIPEVVSSLNIDHRWVPINPDRTRAALRDLPALLNSPGAQPHYQLNTVFASEDAANDGFDLVFTGDGCDAIFLGYPTVASRSSLMSRIDKVPKPVANALLRLLRTSFAERHLGHAARVSRSVLKASMLPYPASGHLPTQYLDDFSLSLLREDDYVPSAETVEQIRIRLAEGLEGLDPKRLAFKGNGATGASRIKVDGSVMATGLAQVTPYKDPHVVHFADSLSPEALRPPGSKGRGLGKQYLIDAVISSGILPEEVVLQPKQSPSTSPIDYWYMADLRSEVLQTLEFLPFDWNRAYVANLLRPKRSEELYRKYVALSPHALQAVGLLVSYGSFARIAS